MYLKHLNLVNFQSWKDLTIDLTEGLNVVVADNGVGKSVIFKALELAINPYKFTTAQWCDFIRYNEEQAVISIVFSDDSGYVVTLTKKNIYYTRATNLSGDAVVENLGGFPPDDLAEKLGSVIRNDLISNFVSMDGTKFLVNSDYNTNHSLLSIPINNEELDRVIETLETEFIPKNKALQKEINNKLSFLSQSLATIQRVDCESLRQNLEFCASLLLALSPLLDIMDDFKRIKKTVNIGKDVINLYECLAEIDNSNSEMSRLHRVPSEISKGISFYNTSQNLTNLVEGLTKIKNLPDQLSLKQANVSYRDCIGINNLLNSLRLVKKAYLSSDVKLLYDNAVRLSSAHLLLKKANSVIEGLSKELEELEYERDEMGGEEFECPIHGKIIYLQGECIPSVN